MKVLIKTEDEYGLVELTIPMGTVDESRIVTDGAPPQVLEINGEDARVRLVAETDEEWNALLHQCAEQLRFEQKEMENAD